MSNNSVHIHGVTSVDVETVRVGLDNGTGYIVRRLVIHSVDHRDNNEELRVTLYGTTSSEKEGLMGIPFNFSAEEDAQ